MAAKIVICLQVSFDMQKALNRVTKGFFTKTLMQ
jgi:hypothetical protein